MNAAARWLRPQVAIEVAEKRPTLAAQFSCGIFTE